MDKNAHVEVVCQLSSQRKRPDSYVKLEVDAEDHYSGNQSEKSGGAYIGKEKSLCELRKLLL